MSERRSGFTDDDDAICKVMMARWADPDVEREPVSASKVASFADMARAVRESDWLAARDASIREDARADLYHAFEEGVAAERANHQSIEMHHHWSSTSSEPPPATPPNPYRAVIDTDMEHHFTTKDER